MPPFKIGGTVSNTCDIMSPYMISAGGGSAYGGDWKPNPEKSNETCLQGPPNTIQRRFIKTQMEGYWAQVKYGDDGWAVKLRHETTHGQKRQHSNPHDHIIKYNPYNHVPIWVKPHINYMKEEYPNGAPEFKSTLSGGIMKMDIVYEYNEEAMRFKTISEFKDSLDRGGEIVIIWKGNEYGIFNDGQRVYFSTPDNDVYYDTADELLEHRIGDDRLRDIITQVVVSDRAV